MNVTPCAREILAHIHFSAFFPRREKKKKKKARDNINQENTVILLLTAKTISAKFKNKTKGELDTKIVFNLLFQNVHIQNNVLWEFFFVPNNNNVTTLSIFCQ